MKGPLPSGSTLLGVLCLLVLAGKAQFDPAALAFGEWMQKYNISYDSQVELATRFGIFNATYIYTVQQNARYQAGNSSFQAELNQYAAIKEREMWELLGIHPMDNSTSYNNTGSQQNSWKQSYANIAPVPSIDWRDQNRISPVKSQGACASDWAFAAVGAIEAAAAIAGGFIWPTDGTNVGYSAQEIVDCGYSPAGSHSDDEGCQGGQIQDAIAWVSKSNLTSSKNYPYNPPPSFRPPHGRIPKPPACNTTKELQAIVSVRDYQLVPPNNETALKQALTVGPVAVAMDASCDAFLYYGGGLLDESCGQDLNHGVLAVGYGTATDPDTNVTASYWIIKNSWGAWGEDGFARIAMLDDSRIHCAADADTPCDLVTGIGGMYSEPVFPVDVKGAAPAPP